MSTNSPDAAEVSETFAVLEQDRATVHRHLITRLYFRPEKWYEARNSMGETLLLAAAREGHNEAVDLLIKKGFPADVWNNALDTALHLTDSATTAGLLLSKAGNGLSLEADGNGDLPLHVQLRRNNPGVVAVLLQCPSAEAQMLRRNVHRETPLFDAARSHWEAVLPLLLMGADPRLTNTSGQTAAEICEDPKTAKTLRAFSAHLDRWDEGFREAAIKASTDQRTVSLAQRAKEFLLGGALPDVVTAPLAGTTPA